MPNSKIEDPKNVSDKRKFRELRSRFKKKLNAGARLDNIILRRYKLINYVSRHYKIDSMKNNASEEILTFEIPNLFSISDNPVATFKFLNDFENEVDKNSNKIIHISHEKCTYLGLVASHFFDKLVKKLVNKYNLRIVGNLSERKDINNFLLATGLLNTLNISHERLGAQHFDSDYKNKFVSFTIDKATLRHYDKAEAAKKLTEYFNSCLNHQGFALTEEATGTLIGIFGEIIDNAEQHSGTQKFDWTVLGCYNKSNLPICHSKRRQNNF